jgi:hypothetical protein
MLCCGQQCDVAALQLGSSSRVHINVGTHLQHIDIQALPAILCRRTSIARLSPTSRLMWWASNVTDVHALQYHRQLKTASVCCSRL